MERPSHEHVEASSHGQVPLDRQVSHGQVPDGRVQSDDQVELAVPARLVAALDRLERARVAVITGPPGHDKAELVRTWLREHPEHRSVWVDEPEDTAALCAAAEAPDPPDHSEAGPGQPSPGLCVLVLHGSAMLGPRALAAEALAIAEQRPWVRVVLVGPARPEVPLGSLAARGLLVDIDAPELAWRRDELAAALASSGPCQKEVDRLHELGRGWPVFCRMLAQSPLDWDHEQKVRTIFDAWLDEQVVPHIDPADLELLLRVSALPCLEPAAVHWMTGQPEAAAQLTRLQARGVPLLREDGNTIRINPLLRLHLVDRLAASDPDRCRRQHRRAAMWLRHRGDALGSVQLAAEAGLVDVAWMLACEWITCRFYRGDHDEVAAALMDVLPAGWTLDLLRSIGRGARTPHTWQSQLHSLDFAKLTQRGTTGRLGYTALSFGIQRLQGFPPDSPVDEEACQAAIAPEQEFDDLDQALLSAACTEYGLWLMHQGRMVEAREVLTRALAAARLAEVAWAECTSTSALALLHAMTGAPDLARRLADDAIRTTASHGFAIDSLDEYALLAQLMVCHDLGDLSGARGWLERLAGHRHQLAETDALRTALRVQAELDADEPAAAQRLLTAMRDQAGAPPNQWHSSLLHTARFSTHLALGELDLADAELDALARLELPDNLTGWQVLRAQLLMARDQPARALALLRPLAQSSEPYHANPRMTLQMLLALGTAADRLHRPEEAVEALQRAAVLAERMGLGAPAARRARLASIVSVAAGADELTVAERNVLAHLRRDQTLGETADAMFISLNTLKTHLRRIYRKLGVSGREEAIERARVMGIQGF